MQIYLANYTPSGLSHSPLELQISWLLAALTLSLPLILGVVHLKPWIEQLVSEFIYTTWGGLTCSSHYPQVSVMHTQLGIISSFVGFYFCFLIVEKENRLLDALLTNLGFVASIKRFVFCGFSFRQRLFASPLKLLRFRFLHLSCVVLSDLTDACHLLSLLCRCHYHLCVISFLDSENSCPRSASQSDKLKFDIATSSTNRNSEWGKRFELWGLSWAANFLCKHCLQSHWPHGFRIGHFWLASGQLRFGRKQWRLLIGCLNLGCCASIGRLLLQPWRGHEGSVVPASEGIFRLSIFHTSTVCPYLASERECHYFDITLFKLFCFTLFSIVWAVNWSDDIILPMLLFIDEMIMEHNSSVFVINKSHVPFGLLKVGYFLEGQILLPL